jgi:hypothetical protein
MSKIPAMAILTPIGQPLFFFFRTGAFLDAEGFLAGDFFFAVATAQI